MSLIIQQTLDFCYWYGVETALRQDGATGQGATLPEALAALGANQGRAGQDKGETTAGA